MTVQFQIEYEKKEITDVVKKILPHLLNERIWLMNGAMGAGKTTLSQQFLSQLSDEEFKGSPTFSLINKYIAKNGVFEFEKIYHFDLYRLNDVEEAWDLGVEEIWNDRDAVSIIEWSEKAAEILPKKTVSLNIDILSPTKRRLTVKTDY